MKLIFVTGGTGLLGANIIEQLLTQGNKVVALVRNISRFVGKRNPNLVLIEGSLFDDFKPDLLGVDFVIHTAGLTAQNMLTYSEYHRINVEATMHLYKCASLAGVTRFVYISSANTMGFGDRTNPGTEISVVRFPFTRSLYAQSKKSAEEQLLLLEEDTEVCIVNPTFMLGAMDSKPSSGQIITRILGKRFIFFPPGGKNFVHVKDVVDGIIKILEFGKSGERYLLANKNMSYLEFYKQVLITTKQKSILIKVPVWLLRQVGMIGNVLRWMGFESNASSINLQTLCINNFFSNQKSVEELGMAYRSIDEAIQDAVEWWRNNSE